MVQNKKFSGGLTLIAALVGLGVSGTASALPEMEVGSHVVQNGLVANAQVLSTDSAQATSDVEDDTDASDEEANSVVN